MLYLVFGVIGLLTGAVSYLHRGSIYGLAIGVMIAEILKLRKRLSKLEKSVKTAASHEPVAAGSIWKDRDEPSHPGPQPKTIHPQILKTVHSGDDDLSDLELEPMNAPGAPAATESVPAGTPGKSTSKSKERFTDLPVRLGIHLKDFFTTGNVVTKIGVIVLFFGIAFLLKYAAQRNYLPIEFRLIGVFLCGLGLLGAGWRLRDKKMMYGLLLQGGGIGVLYLTIFAAARFYQMLPYGFSFVVMICIVVLSGILAVLQDAKYLALFGIVGGFLAPVLMPTGSGSHVAHFTYYALLNIGIAGIAWYKAWRELNLVGFIFTFVFASWWGDRYYQPHYYATTQPFLILFFLCYVAVALLFAWRQPLDLKGYVDGTLVFGMPLVAFGLQYGLVHDVKYGLAVSALILGLFYTILATILWRRKASDFRLISESFLAFGVVFGSLAIPLALDGRWTSAVWALEGGAILWIGIRQRRLLPRLFGMLLQAGSGISFLIAMDNPYRQIAVVNSFFIGCVLISLAGLFSSWYLTRRSDTVHAWERHAVIPLMVWGLAWWFGASVVETERFIVRQDRIAVMLICTALTFLFTDIVSRRLTWKQFSYPALLLLPAMLLAMLYHFVADSGSTHLFAGMGWIAWLIAFSINYRLLYCCDNVWPQKMIHWWHQGAMWLLLAVLVLEGSYYIGVLWPKAYTWQYCVWGVIPGTAVLLLLGMGNRITWPIHRYHDVYLGTGSALPVAFFFLWMVLANFYHGDPAPLPYVPLFNPLVITQIFLLVIALKWIDNRSVWLQKINTNLNITALKMIVFGAGFLILNAVVARCIHFWIQVPYTVQELFDSVLFQAAISILWGLTSLAVTLAATRMGSRPAWIAGASILSLVVVKLFFVDLAGTGTIARIVSFLFVGSLMLIIGYFSPIPPARITEDS